MKTVLHIPEIVWFRPEDDAERDLLSPDVLAPLDAVKPEAVSGLHASMLTVDAILPSGESTVSTTLRRRMPERFGRSSWSMAVIED